MSYLRNRQKNTKSDHSMTTCKKTGIRINEGGNDYKVDPFAGVDPFTPLKI